MLIERSAAPGQSFSDDVIRLYILTSHRHKRRSGLMFVSQMQNQLLPFCLCELNSVFKWHLMVLRCHLWSLLCPSWSSVPLPLY